MDKLHNIKTVAPDAVSIPEQAEHNWNGKFPHIAFHKQVGKTTVFHHHTFEPGLTFIHAFANVLMVETAEGIVLVDVGNWSMIDVYRNTVRAVSKAPVHTAIYTHGHADHVFGVTAFEKEPQHPKVRVVAQEEVPRRFQRYNLTNGYNGFINYRQFRFARPFWPKIEDFRQPDVLYRDELRLNVGGVDFHLYHDLGETDDATWVWIPKYKAIATGDFFVWVAPNCGNPQKVQRYAKEWAEALRRMQKLQAQYIFPGHGMPIIGADRVARALDDTATYLESLVDQTLRLMNQGATLEQVLQQVKPPAQLANRPYLREVYDEPEFIIRNIWRRYGGWYNGDPSELKTPTRAAVAREIIKQYPQPPAVALKSLVDRAVTLVKSAKDSDRRVACNLIELAKHLVDTKETYEEFGFAPQDGLYVHSNRYVIYKARETQEPTLMASGIFRDAARRSRVAAGEFDQPHAKSFAAYEVMESLDLAIAQQPKLRNLKLVITFKVRKADKEAKWTAHLNEDGGVYQGVSHFELKSQAELSINDEDLVKLFQGSLSGKDLVAQNKLSLTGDASVFAKLGEVFASVRPQSKL